MLCLREYTFASLRKKIQEKSTEYPFKFFFFAPTCNNFKQKSIQFCRHEFVSSKKNCSEIPFIACFILPMGLISLQIKCNRNANNHYGLCRKITNGNATDNQTAEKKVLAPLYTSHPLFLP